MWSKLLTSIRLQTLSTQMVPYLFYNDKRSVLQPLFKEHEFSTLMQCQSFTPSILYTAGGVGEIELGRSEQIKHAARHIALIFLRKLKQTVANNTIYTLDDADLIPVSVIRELMRGHGIGMVFVFSEQYYENMLLLRYTNRFHVP